MQQQTMTPAYTVRPLQGTVVRRVCSYVKGKGFQYEDIEEDGGWLVTFPQRHSIHVRTEEELKRMGFTEDAPMVEGSDE